MVVRSTRGHGAARGRKHLVAAAAIGAIAVTAAGGAVCQFTAIDCHLCSLPRVACARAAVPPGFTQNVVVRDLRFPTSFALLPDGRILVGEKAGRIRLVDDGRLGSDAFLDIRPRVNPFSLRGLLAVEPDPDFAENGFIYVLYAHEDGHGPVDAPETVRVSRFETSGDHALAGSERVLLGGIEGESCNARPRQSDCIPADGDQVGGDIAFAPDGSVFVSTGDGSSEEDERNSLRAQNLTSLAGKLLKVTRDGKGRPDNPFWNGRAGDAQSKVWSYGFRNPFRFTLFPGTGEPYVADVGWNTTEEVDHAVAGANFGWPCYEGYVRPVEYRRLGICRSLYGRGRASVHVPAFSYPTLGDRRRASITGGVFYAGSAFPPPYRDAYFFGEWARNQILYVRFARSRGSFVGRAATFVENANGPVELRVGPDGALYYVASKVGELRRISYEG